MLSDYILVDSTVWIESFRLKHSPVSDELADLLHRERVAVCGMVYAEVLQGFKDDAQRLISLFSKLPHMEMDWQVFEKAGMIGRDLCRKGTPHGMSDCLIAATAICAKSPLYTLDKAFKKIPGLNLY